jgi:hypothetical protein
MENSLGVPQKVKNRLTIQSSDTTHGIPLKEYAPEFNRANCTPVFITALFTIAQN